MAKASASPPLRFKGKLLADQVHGALDPLLDDGDPHAAHVDLMRRLEAELIETWQTLTHLQAVVLVFGLLLGLLSFWSVWYIWV
ncbi:hypothetical protein WICPIJ_004505 [Wickerhamomyces pijperi]|uniref:Uncharacterized protein n=1 Tax=Wickerhamomyces pijperi TaxID=599730 RepID=A0A9P8Q7W2_WICPI|nr:hypothetical protein WICPIJ_004505 [Wickerhamomyces pijperi]